MRQRATRIGTITIPSGQTQGNILAAENFATFDQLVIYGPDQLPETITVQVSPEITAGAADMRSLKYNGGAAITFTGASAMVIDSGSFRALSLLAGGATAGARTFTVQGVG